MKLYWWEVEEVETEKEQSENENTEKNNKQLPVIKIWEILKSTKFFAEQNFSRPPARYTEASLVKKMESEGIWRPSTYAPTISTIQDRWYILKEWKYLIPTDISFVVNDFLEKYFNKLMDYKFTANMEWELDDIAMWKIDWKKMLSKFYKEYEKDIDKASQWESAKIMAGKICPECWWELMVRFSSTWKFFWCVNYPTCKYTENQEWWDDKLKALKEKYEWQPCPEWWTILVKIWRFGPFLTSSEYPKVKRISAIPDDKMLEFQEKHWWKECPKCSEWILNVKKFKKSYFLACSKYPDCKYTKSLK